MTCPMGEIGSVFFLATAALFLAVLLALSSAICRALGVRTYWILIALCSGALLLAAVVLFYIAGAMSAAV